MGNDGLRTSRTVILVPVARMTVEAPIAPLARTNSLMPLPSCLAACALRRDRRLRQQPDQPCLLIRRNLDAANADRFRPLQQRPMSVPGGWAKSQARKSASGVSP